MKFNEVSGKDISDIRYQSKLKRIPNRGIAKCLYDYSIPLVKNNECRLKVIRVVLSYPDKSKKKETR